MTPCQPPLSDAPTILTAQADRTPTAIRPRSGLGVRAGEALARDDWEHNQGGSWEVEIASLVFRGAVQGSHCPRDCPDFGAQEGECKHIQASQGVI